MAQSPLWELLGGFVFAPEVAEVAFLIQFFGQNDMR